MVVVACELRIVFDWTFALWQCSLSCICCFDLCGFYWFFMHCFIELFFVSMFCMLSRWGLAKRVCSFGVLLFSELFFLFLSQPIF